MTPFSRKAILDSLPYPFQIPAAAKLRDLLAVAFPRESAILAILDVAGGSMAVASCDTHGSALDIWHDVLAKARCGCYLEAVLTEAELRSPEFAAAYEALLPKGS